MTDPTRLHAHRFQRGTNVAEIVFNHPLNKAFPITGALSSMPVRALMRAGRSAAGRGVMRSTMVFGQVALALSQSMTLCLPLRVKNSINPSWKRSPLCRTLSQLSKVTGPAPFAIRASRMRAIVP